MKDPLIVETVIQAPLQKVWSAYTDPAHIVKWNNASADWHTVSAANDLRVGGTLNYRMEARDGSEGFNLIATYTEVVPEEKLVFVMEDGRQVEAVFAEEGDGVHVTQIFEPETVNTLELQRSGWQSTLDNFKAYVEGSAE